MAKFYGVVGYAELEEISKGSFAEKITEKYSAGDIIRNVTRVQAGNSINDDVTINNVISILSNEYSMTHMFSIRYVKWQGVKWKVVSVEQQYPRILLTIGGVYNGQS